MFLKAFLLAHSVSVGLFFLIFILKQGFSGFPVSLMKSQFNNHFSIAAVKRHKAGDGCKSDSKVVEEIELEEVQDNE